MVSISPRLRDSLDYEEPDAVDPRLSFGFQSVSLESSGYEEHEQFHNDRPLFSSTPERPSSRRKKNQRNSIAALENAPPYTLRLSHQVFENIVTDNPCFSYQPCPDEETFRLVDILPGGFTDPIECEVIWQHSESPTHDYRCLSYSWETTEQNAAILVEGLRLPVTENLLSALHNVRKPSQRLLIWVDQICINQDDLDERAHQVSIMKSIFSNAKEVIVWLGEEDDRSTKLCEYARKMRRGDDSPRSKLNKILNSRQLQDAIQRVLERPWFQRVWVIPEVALAKFTVVAIGRSILSWDNLVRLIRDVQPPQAGGFGKQGALLGNTRQRIAIITQMIASQREGLAHTVGVLRRILNITELLILAKSSQATNNRDKVYAFYGMTHVRTIPSYINYVEDLYIEIAEEYVNNIRLVDSYSDWHGLDEEQRAFQLLSILCSAGALHQHYNLPSWVPDWTCPWHLAPIWAKTGPNRDGTTSGIRGEFRAGGSAVETFEVVRGSYGVRNLCVSAVMIDKIAVVTENTPTSTPGSGELEAVSPDTADSPALRYGRIFFRTVQGRIGIATPGIQIGDDLAIMLGGDVPFVLRYRGQYDISRRAFELLCECHVQDREVMHGELFARQWMVGEDVVLI